MIDQTNPISEKFKITRKDFERLIEFRKNPEARNRLVVFMVGVLFGVISIIGALSGFVRAYNRFFRGRDIRPDFYPMAPITRVAMILGAITAWIITVLCIWTLFGFIKSAGYQAGAITAYLFINTVLTLIAFLCFHYWRVGIYNNIAESNKFGSARFARPDELHTLQNTTGYYIGQGHAFNDRGHLLTVAGTRGGKGTNIIIPNLLGASPMQTSWVVIDPKAENAAITINYQRSIGQNVVILNPWALLPDNVGNDQSSYNPLDMLDLTSSNLVDDIQVIAEMIVPEEQDAKNRFWSDSARTIVSGLLLHLVTSEPKEKHVLTTLWEWARNNEDDWDTMIADMITSEHEMHYTNIQNAGKEIMKLRSGSDETFGNIISGVLQATDFLKSPALQTSLQSGFDPKILVEGKTTVYVIIPADKLKSHARWLRLVVTSMMRAVIRQPKNRVTFLLDEFAALGYLPEIETALSTYAGYNVTVWPILQSLIQLKNLYANNWETFIANCAVRQYFSINDNFSADYVSKAIGQTSHIVRKFFSGNEEPKANARSLVTPDELRRESAKKIFMFIGGLPPTYVDKKPYYTVPIWDKRAYKNPYVS